MTSFVQPNYPTHHEGIERVGDAIDSATNAYRKFDGARGLATFLLAAVISGLLFAANQLIDTWADGHLLAAWIALWSVTFATLALAAGPIRRTVLSIKHFDGSAVYADVCRCEAFGAAGSLCGVLHDPIGQLVFAPADEKKTFETLRRLRQTWQNKPLRAISSTTCRT